MRRHIFASERVEKIFTTLIILHFIWNYHFKHSTVRSIRILTDHQENMSVK